MTSASDSREHLTTAPRTPNQDVLKLARGSGIGVVGTAVSQGSMFLVVALLVVSLGTTGVGRYSTVFAILVLLSLTVLVGAQTTLTRYIAQHLAAGEPGHARTIERVGIAVPTTISVLVGIALALAASTVSETIFHDPLLVGPIRMVCIALPLAAYSRTAAAILQGHGDVRDLVLITLVVEPGARLVLTAVALTAGWGLLGATAALILSNTASAVWAFRRLRSVCFPTAGSAQVRWSPLVRFSCLTWTATIATTGLVWLDTLLIAGLRSADDVGIYQVATRVLALATVASGPIAVAMSPRIAEFMHRREWARLETIYALSGTWSTRLAVPLIVLCATLPSQVLGLFGPAFPAAAAVTTILAVGKLVEAATGPCGMVLNMSSRVGLNAANNAVALALNVALNLILIPSLGLAGAGLAWSASLIALNLARMIEVRRLIGISNSLRRVSLALLGALPLVGIAAGAGVLLPSSLSVVVGAPTLIIVYAVIVRCTDWRTCDGDVIASLLPRRSRPVRGRNADETRRRSAPKVDHSCDLSIGELISPLRYDVLVRARFFDFIDQNVGLWDADPSEFMRLARRQPYHVWFTQVALRQRAGRRRPGPVVSYDQRVRRSVALYRSFRTHGFDSCCPITVWEAEKALPTDSGKLVSRSHFVCDGCHRLALVMSSGISRLTPEMVRIQHIQALKPRDNTVEMLRAGLLSEAEYTRFLEMGYVPGRPAHATLAGLLASVVSMPNADELHRVAAVDAPFLGTPTLDHPVADLAVDSQDPRGGVQGNLGVR